MNPHQSPAHPLRALWSAAFAVVSILFPAGATSLSACETNPGSACKPSFTAIYVFGDSLSDTGRTAAVLNPPFNAESDWLNGRESNGPLWVEYLSPLLGLKYDPRNNFAWCGATSGRDNTDAEGLPGMRDELDEFLGDLPATGADSKALYVVFAGSNDFLAILRGERDPEIAIPEAIGNIVTTVATLRAAGAQHIVVVGVPDISLTPRVQAYPAESIAAVNMMCVQFEAGLLATLDGYGLEVSYVSTVDLLGDMVAHPRRYGFLNVTEPSLPNLFKARYSMFWNDIHPTTLTHAWLARAVYDALELGPVHRRCGPWIPWVCPRMPAVCARR